MFCRCGEYPSAFHGLRQHAIGLLISFLIGALLAVIICPYLIFNPTDINYLRLDEGQNFYGWAFFRQDSWHWPLTVTTRLMYPVGTSIVFTDSYPILSIALKCLSSVLPSTFIFNGIVLVINFSLIFYAGNLLLRRLTNDAVFSFFGSFFFVFATPFLFRFSASHAALSSHWVLILGFIPLLASDGNYLRDLRWLWGLLLISFGIHAYLASMLMILLLAYVAQLLLFRPVAARQVAKVSLAGVLGTIFGMYFFGYFYNFSTGQSTGFGFFCANLATFFNPILNSSAFFPAMEQPAGQVGGYAYLGLGIFLMGGVAFHYLFMQRPWRRDLAPLYLAVIGCFFLSLSNNIYWGKSLLLHFDIGNIGLLNVFRSSNRYIWVAYYAILIFCLLAFFRSVKPIKFRNYFLICLLVIQLIDIFPLINRLHEAFIPKPLGYEYGLDKDFWFSLGSKYKHMQIDLNYVGQFNNDEYGNAHVYKLANIAVKNGLTLNVFYLARTSKANEDRYLDDYRNFLRGILAPNTVYIMSEKTMLQTVPGVSKHCRIVDNYYVCGTAEGDR